MDACSQLGQAAKLAHLAQAAGKLLVDCVKEQFVVDVLAIWYRGPRLLQVQKEFQACRGAHWPGCVPQPANLILALACITLNLGLGTASGSHSPCTIFSRNAIGFMPLSALPAERSPLDLLGVQASRHQRPQAHPGQPAPAAAPHFAA